MDLTSIIDWTAQGGLTLVAQAAGGAGGEAGAAPYNPTSPMLLMFAALGIIMYVMVLRPKQKEDRERANALDSLERGDKIVTNGGIHGTVEGIDAAKKTVSITIAPKTTITIDKWAVHGVTPKKKRDEKEEKKAESDAK